MSACSSEFSFLAFWLKTPSPPAVVKDGTGAVLFLRFSPDGRELARICQFGPVALLDTAGYHRARTFSVGMRMVAYSPDGTKIATAEGRTACESGMQWSKVD